MEDKAMFMDSLPCNSIPFLKRMLLILEEHKVNNPDNLPEEDRKNFERNLWLVNAQTYGQVARIDMGKKYQALKEISCEG